MWFLFSLASTLGWGCADLFYKKGTDDTDRYSHLKIAVWVGLLMGVCSACLLPLCETAFSLEGFFVSAAKYLPASVGYIVSMVIGYAGLRYLEVSIVSPVQNASGALSAVVMMVFFTVTGRITHIGDELSMLDIIGTLVIVIGVIALAVAEHRLSQNGVGIIPETEKKYRYGALALIFPILYCVFDTLGTSADGIILDGESGLGLGEIDVIVVYGFTFFVSAVAAWVYMLLKTKKAYNPFTLSDIKTKGVAAACEQIGQIFYVYAMAAKPVLAAPMIASYCIVSVLLSRVFLKEKLERSQNLCIISVIAGIVILGISEGISS